jgi:transposase
MRRLAKMQSNRIVPGLVVGLDVSDEYTQVCVLNVAGDVVEESRVRTDPANMRRRFTCSQPMRVALEAGPHSPWLSRLLAELGHEVIVANARKLRMIYQNDRKSDRADARYLARVARLDPQLLGPLQHRGVQTQADLALVRARTALVAARTKLVNHVRGTVKAFGVRLNKGSTQAFSTKAALAIPEELQPALKPLLDTIAHLSSQIRTYELRMRDLCRERYPHTELLQQVAGVGPITSLTYVLTIENPARFRKSRVVGSYLGLTCRRSQSGDQDPELRITKAGDTGLRYLLVQSAHYILGPFGPDTDLRRWGLALASRGRKNAKKRALVAVARKLAVLLHHLWVTAQVYEPLRNPAPAEALATGAV